jgi:hypothetical protein
VAKKTHPASALTWVQVLLWASRSTVEKVESPIIPMSQRGEDCVSEMLETAANDHNPGVTSDQAPKEDATLHEIVIVGGGAAGLELATGLGNTLARRKRARITLVDKARAHLWKPLLHSVAAGSLDFDEHALDYLAQAHWHHFGYRFGEGQRLRWRRT